MPKSKTAWDDVDENEVIIPEAEPLPAKPVKRGNAIGKIVDVLKKAVPTPEQPEPATTPDFPANPKEAFELLTRLDNDPPHKDREQEIARQTRLNAVKKHVFNLQQGLAPVEVTADDLAKGRLALIQRQEQRESRIAALRKIAAGKS